MLYLEYYLRPRGSRVSNHLEIRRSVVGGERKELLFLSDLFILVRNAACVNFYGNAAWFTTQYLEEISRRRKIEGGMITFPPFSFYFYAPSTPWITTRLLLFPDYIFFFLTLKINDPTLMKFVPPRISLKELFWIRIESDLVNEIVHDGIS